TSATPPGASGSGSVAGARRASRHTSGIALGRSIPVLEALCWCQTATGLYLTLLSLLLAMVVVDTPHQVSGLATGHPLAQSGLHPFQVVGADALQELGFTPLGLFQHTRIVNGQLLAEVVELQFGQTCLGSELAIVAGGAHGRQVQPPQDRAEGFHGGVVGREEVGEDELAAWRQDSGRLGED